MSESPDYDPSQSPRGEGTAPWGKSPLHTREKILGDAVETWIAVRYQQGSYEASLGQLDEADLALEKVLVEQGVLQAGDEAFFESGLRGYKLVHVYLDEVVIQIDTDGKIERF